VFLAKVGVLIRNFLKVTLKLLLVTLVILELTSQIFWAGRDACSRMFGQEICLLPRPILSTEQVRILSRLIEDQETYVRFEPVLGWSIRPNQRVEHEGTTYTSNEIGIRALRSYSHDPPEGVTRIAAFGPSFTHGDEVSDDATWTYLLEQAQPGLEVMNWGVGGYGTDQAYLRYKTRGVAYAPDIVLIGYEDENLYRNVSRFRPFYQSKTERPLTKPVFALEGKGLELLSNPFKSPTELRDAVLKDPNRFLEATCPTDYHCLKPGYQRFALDRLKSFRLLRTLAFALQYPQLDKTRGAALVRSYKGPPSPPEETTFRILRVFADEVQRNDALPLIIFFPSPTTVMAYANGEMPDYQPLITRLQAEGTAHILDLTGAFTAAMQEQGVEFDAFVSPVGGHYNEAGNRVVSQAVLDYLIEIGVYAQY
jgi:hypothetical protein